MRILVTGGAGFIGLHTAVELVRQGHVPVLVDNFANSRRANLAAARALCGQHIELVELDVRNRAALERVFHQCKPDGVIHFAALKSVGESWTQAMDYHDNNVGGLLSVLACMRAAGVPWLVFSSSAPVYGDATLSPIPEHAVIAPQNPYARTKAICEQILGDMQHGSGIRTAILRYFNPVGAHPSGRLGEDPLGVPNNLMPYVCQVAAGRLPVLRVFGSDYPTADGTGVRDYLHVVDLAEAHVAALEALGPLDGPLVVNLGRGEGYSVLELVRAFEDASGREVPLEFVSRRPGDVATCYAQVSLAHELLGWRAKRDLPQMCEDAWLWECQRA